MKILHVETGRHLYGGALQVRYLLEGLSRIGVENHLAAPPGSAIAKASTPVSIVHEIPTIGDLDISLGFRLVNLIRRIQPDIFHIHSRRGADIWGAAAARIMRIPAVLTRRVDNPEPKILCRFKYRSFHQVIAISDKIAGVLTAQGVDPHRIAVIRSAVDAEQYAIPCNEKWFGHEFQIQGHPPVIGVIAQLIERKGHRDLIEAMPRIIHSHPDARFLFFGKGPEKAALKELCRLRNVQSHVFFAGFRDNIERILPCLTLVVHPAKMEGLGVALLQASAAGVPIVACKAGGIPEVVEDGMNGLLVPPSSPESLAHAICRILKDPELGKRLGDNGRQRIAGRFSIDLMVQEYMAVYRRLSAKQLDPFLT
jgi:glycosyltransferase involved in cell wall biosynthesis